MKLDSIGRVIDKRYRHGGIVLDLTLYLTENPRFQQWSGSSKHFHHHYGDGGLVKHTQEVVETCLATADLYPQYQIDQTELFLAALYHDSGKMYDYEKDDIVGWRGSEHKRLIHHISRSVIIWAKALDETGVTDEFRRKYEDPVIHAILAHHGQRIWGSPVSPKSRVAWLLYLCDGISARLNDADTLDIANR
jgi:3'-5' exoribonuclease